MTPAGTATNPTFADAASPIGVSARRDAADSSSKSHTIIVGAGVIGVCAAWYLAKRGQRVTLIDKSSVAAGASFGNAGIIAAGHLPLPKPGLAIQAIKWMLNNSSPLYIQPRLDWSLISWLWQFHRACNADRLGASMDVLSAMGHAMVPCFEEMIGADNIQCEYQRAGWMQVFRTERGRQSGLHEAEMLRGYGFDVDVLSEQQLKQREPCFVDEVIGAIHYRDSAFADPGKFVIEAAKAAQKHGVEIRTNSPVTEILTGSGAFTGVRIANGETIQGDTLILAGGAWTTALAKQLGINVPMQPAKGYHRNLTAPPRLPSTTCVLAETFVAATPIAGELRLAGTLEFSGINDNLVTKRLDMLSVGAKKYIRDLERTQTVSVWSGLRPCTADGLPVIGWAPNVGGVFIATGHAMMGFALGPITGKLVCQCVLGEKPQLDISAMSVERFKQARGTQRRAAIPSPTAKSQ